MAAISARKERTIERFPCSSIRRNVLPAAGTIDSTILTRPAFLMRTLPIRLRPNQNLRAALEAILAEHSVSAAFVLQGIGSLSIARVRYAGMSEVTELRGDLEILTLSGSLGTDGAHLHIAVADAQGRVVGGHVADGCIVRTTAEILLALLPTYHFSREPDAESGWRELAIRSIPGSDKS